MSELSEPSKNGLERILSQPIPYVEGYKYAVRSGLDAIESVGGAVNGAIASWLFRPRNVDELSKDTTVEEKYFEEHCSSLKTGVAVVSLTVGAAYVASKIPR